MLHHMLIRSLQPHSTHCAIQGLPKLSRVIMSAVFMPFGYSRLIKRFENSNLLPGVHWQ